MGVMFPYHIDYTVLKKNCKTDQADGREIVCQRLLLHGKNSLNGEAKQF
jgi:hypothetical protein